MRVLVDFHYSDRWADPGAQITPAAWRGYDAAQLAAAVGAHTREVLTALRRAGAPADLVQLGNEINPGLLHPLGQTWDVDPDDGVTGAQWDNVAAFLTAGAEAVEAVEPRTQVLLHLTNINNGVDSLTWWFDEVTARGVPFDLIGLSYYGYWHGSLADLQDAVTTLSARYDRDVVVVETAYPWTLADHPTVRWENIIDLPAELVPGYPATPAGQAAQFRAVQDAVASAAGGRGLGAVYWEPAWTAVAGRRLGPGGPGERQRLGEPGAVRPRRPPAAGSPGAASLTRRSAPARPARPARPAQGRVVTPCQNATRSVICPAAGLGRG